MPPGSCPLMAVPSRRSCSPLAAAPDRCSGRRTARDWRSCPHVTRLHTSVSTPMRTLPFAGWRRTCIAMACRPGRRTASGLPSFGGSAMAARRRRRCSSKHGRGRSGWPMRRPVPRRRPGAAARRCGRRCSAVCSNGPPVIASSSARTPMVGSTSTHCRPRAASPNC